MGEWKNWGMRESEANVRAPLAPPRLFPFAVTVGALTVIFIIVELALIAQGKLVPGVMILGSFILFVLFLTGLIETAIQLFGAGKVSDNCQLYVYNQASQGPSLNTLAFLEQKSICECFPVGLTPCPHAYLPASLSLPSADGRCSCCRRRLEGRLCVLDCRLRAVCVDDCHVGAGGAEQVRLGGAALAPFLSPRHVDVMSICL